MSWFGKVAGAAIGFIIGGPLGAAGGAYLGHKLFDTPLTGEEKVNANYFIALFSMLGKMAKADGRVTKDEVDTVDRVIRERLRFNDEQRKFAINIFNEAKESSYSFEEFADNFYNMNRNKPDLLLFMLNTLFELAIADGVLHPEEERLLIKAKNIFGISDQIFENLKKQNFPKITKDKYYGALNCSPTDPDSIIKRNYRKLIQEFHPDKIENKGLPEEFKEYSKKKFQEIQDAWDYIKEERGF